MPTPFKPTIVTYCLAGRYRTDDGKRVTKATPGAVRVVTKSKIWYGNYTDANGVRRRVKLGPNRSAAVKILAKLVTDVALGRHGALDGIAESNERPITAHLDDWEAHLRLTTNARRHKNTPRHV